MAEPALPDQADVDYAAIVAFDPGADFGLRAAGKGASARTSTVKACGPHLISPMLLRRIRMRWQTACQFTSQISTAALCQTSSRRRKFAQQALRSSSPVTSSTIRDAPFRSFRLGQSLPQLDEVEGQRQGESCDRVVIWCLLVPNDIHVPTSLIVVEQVLQQVVTAERRSQTESTVATDVKRQRRELFRNDQQSGGMAA